MDDASDLQARIARLAGRINRHKTGEESSRDPNYSNNTSQYTHTWVPQRGTPYGIHRGRGWNSRPASHRNRTLVVNAPQQDADSQDAANPAYAKPSGPNENLSSAGWVTKHDRHMQLINNSVYEQKTQQRTRAMEETRRQKEFARNELEKVKFNNHLEAVAASHYQTSPAQSKPSAHQILVDNMRFIIADGGSKLVKAQDDANLSQVTPKRVRVGGVTFLRSRNGNLYRAGLVRTKRRTGIRMISEPCTQFSTTGSVFLENLDEFAPTYFGEGQADAQLTTFIGSCAKGPQCRYIHDPEKVAICRDFLQSGKCQAGDDCDLSHNPIPERVPACLHFLRGNCTNSECRYAHIKTNSGAPVCRSFAVVGYCSKGVECAERHVHECPDYANKGICRNAKCRLPHVDRAGQLRKAVANENSEMDEEASSDISSDAGSDSDDVDSDDFDDDMLMQSNVDNHKLSQQEDFVHF